MATEIEYKFLVHPEVVATLPQPFAIQHIQQGYISTDPSRIARIRLLEWYTGQRGGRTAFITIKGKSDGLSRGEWEYEIPFEDGIELIKLCGDQRVEKTRHLHRLDPEDLTIELDIFSGKHEGLVIAEVEVPSVDTQFERPEWFGKDVSTDHRYTNSSLCLSDKDTTLLE